MIFNLAWLKKLPGFLAAAWRRFCPPPDDLTAEGNFENEDDAWWWSIK